MSRYSYLAQVFTANTIFSVCFKNYIFVIQVEQSLEVIHQFLIKTVCDCSQFELWKQVKC